MYYNQLMCDISSCNWLSAFPLLQIWIEMALVRLHYWVYALPLSLQKCQNVQREYPCKLYWARCRQRQPWIPMQCPSCPWRVIKHEPWLEVPSRRYRRLFVRVFRQHCTVIIKPSAAYYDLFVGHCKLIFRNDFALVIHIEHKTLAAHK